MGGLSAPRAYRRVQVQGKHLHDIERDISGSSLNSAVALEKNTSSRSFGWSGAFARNNLKSGYDYFPFQLPKSKASLNYRGAN